MVTKKRFICFIIIQLIVLFLLPSVCISAVSGTVTDTNGDPVINAEITFTDESDPEIVYTGVTGQNGYYEVMGTASITENDNTPESFSLFQNYPNPFNPSTVIPFSINGAGFIELSLYNMLGQKVRTLINGYCTAGKQSVIWNGLDDEGKNAGSGIYIYRLKQGNFTETRKLLLLDGGYTGSGNGLACDILIGNQIYDT